MSGIPAAVTRSTSQPWLTPAQHDVWRAYVAVGERLFSALSRDLQARSGISGPDFAVLVAITDAPARELRAVDLQRTLGWEQSRLSHQVTRMQRRGLVDKAACATDRRGTVLRVTDSGRAALDGAAADHAATVRRLVFDGAGDDELAAVHSFLARTAARLDDGDDGSCDT